MIRYFGTPISGAETVAITALRGAHGFVSFYSPGQLKICAEFCDSFAVDNGAFSYWRSNGANFTEWEKYYAWVESIKNYPNFDWAIIPDVIAGTEAENDALLEAWPFDHGVPVWHMGQSVERINRLQSNYERIAIGGAAAFDKIMSPAWWAEINKFFKAICTPDGLPRVKIHGLLMLNPKIFTRLPLSSADSTSLGRNVGIDKAWSGTYAPSTKEARAMVLRQRVEQHQAATRFIEITEEPQEELF